MIRQTNQKSDIGVLPMVRSPRGGFTLLEMLIVVFIITLLISVLLIGVFRAKKAATVIRTKDDLQLISTALTAYHDEFGDYPRFADPLTDYNSINPSAIPGNGTWLDYSNMRGAVLLCRTLLGPGPAGTSTYANPGDDGADGPGFRVRRNGGKVYGPYVDGSKFKIGYVGGNTAYPTILDGNSNPILYYPGAPSSTSDAAEYVDPSTFNPVNPVIPPFKFNVFDDFGSNQMNATNFRNLTAASVSQPYLLWTAGTDGIFGYDKNGKIDDVGNFDLPDNK